MTFSRRGIAFDVVIMLTLAVLALLLIGAFLSGGFGSLGKKAMTFSAESSSGAANSGQIVNCNQLCGAIMSCSEPDAIDRFLSAGCNNIIDSCEMAEKCVECEAPEPDLC